MHFLATDGDNGMSSYHRQIFREYESFDVNEILETIVSFPTSNGEKSLIFWPIPDSLHAVEERKGRKRACREGEEGRKAGGKGHIGQGERKSGRAEEQRRRGGREHGREERKGEGEAEEGIQGRRRREAHEGIQGKGERAAEQGMQRTGGGRGHAGERRKEEGMHEWALSKYCLQWYINQVFRMRLTFTNYI
jgi:hypothetical protein